MSIKPRHARTAQAVLQPPTCQCQQSLKPFIQQRSLHTSPRHHIRTRLRRDMDEWFAGPVAKNLKTQLPGSTNYLSAYDSRDGVLLRTRRRGGARRESEDDAAVEEKEEGLSQEEADGLPGVGKETLSDLKPFPLNPHFRSESVLSEEMREEVYQQVVVNGIDITTISANYGIDIRRVAAVVRLKTIEKQWQTEGKKLATPYSKAVLDMLPKTPFRGPNGQVVKHESINDLPVHSATRNQLFWPASESRSFTREDAAKAFSQNLLPADQRIPHPELIELEKWNIEGISREEKRQRLQKRDAEQAEAKRQADAKQKEWEERTQRVVQGRRWDFKFQDISVESAGPNGRGQHGVGLRYGYAHIDRKRGISKIPTSVE